MGSGLPLVVESVTLAARSRRRRCACQPFRMGAGRSNIVHQPVHAGRAPGRPRQAQLDAVECEEAQGLKHLEEVDHGHPVGAAVRGSHGRGSLLDECARASPALRQGVSLAVGHLLAGIDFSQPRPWSVQALALGRLWCAKLKARHQVVDLQARAARAHGPGHCSPESLLHLSGSAQQ